jgi:hypothetical protein
MQAARLANPPREGAIHNPVQSKLRERQVLSIPSASLAPTSCLKILGALNPLCVTLKIEKFIPIRFASSVHPLPSIFPLELILCISSAIYSTLQDP